LNISKHCADEATHGRSAKPRHREARSDVAIHEPLITKRNWIASRHVAALLAAKDFVRNDEKGLMQTFLRRQRPMSIAGRHHAP
jgi:hypothetical protein